MGLVHYLARGVDVGDAAVDLAQDHLELEAGQVGAEAVVLTESERQLGAGLLAGDVEYVGLVEQPGGRAAPR